MYVELPKVVRAVYKDDVLKLLEPVELGEGEKVLVRLERYKDRVRRLRKYRGILGKASKEERSSYLV
ncbi:MAG: antitoxin family protein [Desulfurococcales archaeon]|nr:antitoxin family protein [Desulfurococcales archaeon]